MRTKAAIGIALGLVLALGATPAPAQQPKPAEAGPPSAPPAAPPYEPDLLALAETLGALTHLAGVCPEAFAENAASWRAKAQALVDAEAANPERRTRLIGLFNRGYAGYAFSYRVCTPNARLAVTRLLAKAADETRRLTARFGG
jgi:uncharacterized protein (TIGR02301 family)